MQTVYYYGAITQASIEHLIDDMDEAIEESKKEEGERVIRLIICSEGGSLGLAMHAYDMLCRLQLEHGFRLITVASGYCFSAGTLLLQAGIRRYAMPNAMFMVHPPYQVNWSDETEIDHSEVGERQALHALNIESMARVYATRNHVTNGTWKRRLSKAGRRFMSAEQAIAFGLADELVATFSEEKEEKIAA